jgi:TonB family protein
LRSTCEKILTLVPDSKEAHQGLAAVMMEAIETARMGVRSKAGMKPDEPGPISNIDMRIEFQDQYSGQINDSIRHLERVLEKDPKFVPAVALMSQLLRARADYATDAEAYKRQIAEADQWMAKLPPPPPPAAARQIRIDGPVQQAKLRKHVPPEYPPQASHARIQGVVQFDVVIDAQGKIGNVRLVSGHPLLVPFATEALRQWEYQPTLLDGQPVEVATSVNVEFTLN